MTPTDELGRILEAWRTRRHEDGGVLATVVHVSGSAYRRPGARMLVLPQGQRVGMVSGGCLEGEIVRKAWWYTESDRPVVRVYDTTSSDDVVAAFGLGCNGIVHVMLERVGRAGTAALLEFLDAHRQARIPAVVATVVEAGPDGGLAVGDRLLVDATGVVSATLTGAGPMEAVRAQAMEALARRRSWLAHLAGAAVFVEYVAPPIELLVLGAGDDAQPLVQLASQLGWRVTVADGRPAQAVTARFPEAVRVAVLPAAHPADGLPIDANTVVVMMTHNLPLDVRLLPTILDRRPRYLGLLGPRARAERLFAEAGRELTPDIHAPVGLDLGADSPAAIALAVVAEIQAVVNSRAGGMLRLREDAIHAPVREVGERQASPAQGAERPDGCEILAGSHAA